jgi:rRNA maturation protein Nop10
MNEQSTPSIDRTEQAGLYICNGCPNGVRLTITDDPYGGLSIPNCPVCGENMTRQVPAQYEVQTGTDQSEDSHE